MQRLYISRKLNLGLVSYSLLINLGNSYELASVDLLLVEEIRTLTSIFFLFRLPCSNYIFLNFIVINII